MSLTESDTRAKLIDPALHAKGWTEHLIRREETAGAIEIVDGKPRKHAKGWSSKFKYKRFERHRNPLPPLSEQKRISGILKEQIPSVERLRKALEGQLEAINKLPAVILRRAFSGEL